MNTLVRNPILIPYTLGGKSLDKIYLDTTFARADNVCYSFPSKADGLAELLRKVAKYPQDTIFYFRAWTFGYEEVWVALSAALNTKVRYMFAFQRRNAANILDSCRSISARPLSINKHASSKR